MKFFENNKIPFLMLLFFFSCRLAAMGYKYALVPNKCDYVSLADQGDSDQDRKSFRLKMNCVYNIVAPNEINFLFAVKNGDTTTIDAFLKTKFFRDKASTYLFRAATDIANQQGNKKLATRFLKMDSTKK